MPHRLFFLRKLSLGLLAIFFSTTIRGEIPREELVLRRALPVEGPQRLEPSGLCAINGRLYAVSDKHDSTLFSVVIDGDVARLVPELEFQAPRHLRRQGRLDFEAVIPAGRGKGFLLGSEGCGDVLWVRSDGATPRWLGLPLEEASRRAGLFQGKNAGLEGLALRDEGRQLVVAAERDPRGLAVFSFAPDTSPELMHAEAGPPAVHTLPSGRSPDFSELCIINRKLFALSRNAEQIVSIAPQERGLAGWHETAAWSYSAALHLPETEYTHQQFGMAEGFAVAGESLWMIFDNNRSYYRARPNDRRPMLLEFERPKGLR